MTETPGIMDDDLDHGRQTAFIDGIPGASQSASRALPEWIPATLRRWTVIMVSLTLLGLIGVLELLNHTNRRHDGFSADQNILVLATRYLPTAIAIIIGFMWKKFVWDMKKMTPWAVMTGTWAVANDSLLANYLDDLELVSLWRSRRRRHWGLTLALFGGLLVGSAVIFTTTLFYVDPIHTSRSSAQLLRTSTLAVNESLVDLDDLLRDRVFAAVLAVQRFDSQFPPWTSNKAAYESFNVSSTVPSSDATISADALEFRAHLECHPVAYTVEMISPWEVPYAIVGGQSRSNYTKLRLVPDEVDLIRSRCPVSQPNFPMMYFRKPTNSSERDLVGPTAWMNVTRCGNGGSRVSLTMIELLRVDDGVADAANSFRATGTLCQPRYSVGEVRLTVNASTGAILDAGVDAGQPTDIDLGNTTETLVATINRGESKGLFVEGDLRLLRWDAAVDGLLRPSNNSLLNLTETTIDPWFYMMSSGQLDTMLSYSGDTAKLIDAATDLFGTIVAQCANVASRNEHRSPTSGWVTVRQPRVLMRQSSLRVLQAILALMGIAMALCSTALRPRTVLIEDPATLGAVAVLLSRSELLEAKLDHSGLLAESDIKQRLNGMTVRLTLGSGGKPMVQTRQPTAADARDDERSPMVDTRDTDLREVKPPGYRPVVLHAAARMSLLAVMVAIVFALGLLLAISRKGGGLAAYSERDYYMWSYLPVVTLVLLGYALQGVDAAIQCLQPYLALRRGSVVARKAVLFSPGNHMIFSLAYRSLVEAGSWALFASSMTVLIYPAVKVATAGLYIQRPHFQTSPVPVEIDRTLMANLDTLGARSAGGSTFKETWVSASYEVAKWIGIRDFNFPPPPGTLGPFIFGTVAVNSSEAANEALANGATVAVRISAIEVDVSCAQYDHNDFEITAKPLNSDSKRNQDVLDGWFGLYADCLVEDCSEQFSSISRHSNRSSLVRIEKSDHRYFSSCRPKEGKNSDLLSCLFGKIDPPDRDRSNSTWRINPDAVAAVSCSGRFKKVDVNVTLAQQAKPDHRRVSLLPTAVTVYDQASAAEVLDQAPYDSYLIDWIKPGVFFGSSPLFPQELRWSGSALPPHFEARQQWSFDNFWKVLVTRERANGGDIETLLDPGHLAEATRDLYTIFCTQLINQLRSEARALGSNTVQRSGAVTQQAVRVYQDVVTTIFLQVTLVVIGVCVSVAFWRTPTKAIIPKAPNSIAAQVSMLAESQLVRKLREEEVMSVEATNIWDQLRFSMRWWSSRRDYLPLSLSSFSLTDEGRWGIDSEPVDQELVSMRKP